ncbi:hypothetical protein ACEPAH_8536 [Sanghuangporus vaninii]
MANNIFPPPVTPKKIYLREPLHPANFVTPVSGTVSSLLSHEGIVVNPGDLLKGGYEVVDIRSKVIIPLDAFLIGMGVSQSALQANDESISAIASSNDVLQRRNAYCTTTAEAQRYGPFCELSNFIISKFSYKLILFTRNDPRLLSSPYTHGGLKPDVLAFNADFPQVANNKWLDYSSRGPLKESGVTWEWKHVSYVAEFKRHLETFLPDPENQSTTWSPQDVSHSNQLSTRLRGTSKSRGKRTTSSRASDRGSSRVSNPSSKRGEARKPAGKATQTVSISHSTSTSASRGRGTLSVLPSAILPAPPNNSSTSERRKRRREEMVNEGEETGTAEKLAKLEDHAKRETLHQDLEICGAKYAIDLMSSVPNRRHVFELLIIDDRLRLAYYDRAGPVYSESFYFTEDVYRFVLLLKRLAELDRWETGFLECLEEAEVPTEEILDALLSEGGGGAVQQTHGGDTFELVVGNPTSTSVPVTDSDIPSDTNASQPVGYGLTKIVYPGVLDAIEIIKSGKHLFTLRFDCNTVAFLILEIGGRRHYGLISRGTSVFLCYLISPDHKGLFAIKLSWPQARRQSEADILRLAREVLREFDADPKYREEYGDRKLEESLPFVITAKDIDDLKKEQSFRWATQEFYENFDAALNRIYRAIAMEVLHPLYSLTRLDHFKEAIRDIVLAHHFLYKSTHRILHRDISLHNLMVRFYVGCDRIHGVLIDFDLASLGVPTSEGHFGRRTGTRPYMSIDLLKEETPLHLERFDWESFFYVICWIATHYLNGDKINTETFNEWHELEDNKLRSIKAVLLYGLSTPNLRHLFTDFFKPLISLWMDDIQSMFLEADQARRKFERAQEDNPEDSTLVFDEETLGGHVTWEKFWGILRR